MSLIGIEGVTIEKACFPPIYAEWIEPEDAEEGKAILYFHGDSFSMGNDNSYREIVGNFVKQVGYKALLFDYPLAPGFPAPAVVSDSAAIYHRMLEAGYRPEDIIFAGDSTGGEVELGTMLKLRDDGLPLPAGCVAFSPCLDFNSPLYDDLTGLPPIMIHVGNEEVLRDAATLFGLKADSFQVDARVKVWEGMYHCFPLFAPRVEDATEAMLQVKRFITQQMHKENGRAAAFLYMTMFLRF